MLYHIPHLDSVPIISGKPYLAMDGYVGAVRVLLTMETMADFESSRHSKFLADELFRSAQKEEEMQLRDVEDSGESHDQEGKSPDMATLRRSVSDPNLPVSRAEVESRDREEPQKGVGFKEALTVHVESRYEEEHEFEKSVTPFLPDPSTILEESIEDPTIPEEERSEVTSDRADDEDDYDTDELESRKKFGGGIQTSPSIKTGETIEEAPPDPMDLSMRDSGDYSIPTVDLLMGAGHAFPSAAVDKENPYNIPSELDSVNFEKRDALLGGESNYSIPRELEVKGVGPGRAEGDYDFPSELVQARPTDVNLYEDPVTLTKGKTYSSSGIG